jgi:diacylglycerol kinase family enzyme
MIGIFVNTKAGKGNAAAVQTVIEKKLNESRIPFIMYTDEWPQTIELTEAWVVGGDGTLNYFINKYPQLKIPLVIFKGGTGNDFAWKLYGNLNTAEQITRVFLARAQPVDAASCNGKLFVNSVGIGFDGEVLRSMGAIRKLGGHIGYLWVVLKKIFRFREFSFTITASNTILNQQQLLVNIANAPRTGGGFLISPQAAINDGKLNLILCSPLSIIQRLRFLPVIEKGKHLKLPFIQHRLIENIQVACSRPVYAQLDGELIHHQQFDITVLPGYFLFKY